MTRQEAIKNIIENWRQADNELCCSSEERRASAEDMKQSLLALGVSEEEMK